MFLNNSVVKVFLVEWLPLICFVLFFVLFFFCLIVNDFQSFFYLITKTTFWGS